MTTAETPQKPELTSELEKLSYAFGSNIGKWRTCADLV